MQLATLGRTSQGLDIVACALCGEHRTRHRYTKFGLAIVECLGCGLVYSNPRLAPDAVARRYSRDYFWNEYLPTAGAPGGQVDLEFLDRHLGAWVALLNRAAGGQGRVFEIGTGAGLLLKVLQRAGWSVSGLEVNPEAVAFARERLGLDVSEADAEELGAFSGPFDAVVMLDVIEHMADPLGTASHARRLLRPGGVLLVQTPNFFALSRRVLGAPWGVLTPAEHLYYFSDATLSRLLRSAGFGDVRFEGRLAGHGPNEAMNPLCTHAPRSWRSRAYAALVRVGSTRLLEFAAAHRLTDHLICVARA